MKSPVAHSCVVVTRPWRVYLDLANLNRRSGEAMHRKILRLQRVLLKVEDEEGNVVLLRAGGVVAGKTGDVVEESVSETSGRDMELRFQEFFAACLAEFFLHGVLGFEESVRIEQTAISGANADFHGRIGCL